LFQKCAQLAQAAAAMTNAESSGNGRDDDMYAHVIRSKKSGAPFIFQRISSIGSGDV
jgi:hypothetical protein